METGPKQSGVPGQPPPPWQDERPPRSEKNRRAETNRGVVDTDNPGPTPSNSLSEMASALGDLVRRDQKTRISRRNKP